MARHRGAHRPHTASVEHPVVFYEYGHWWRTGHPSTYDRWLVTAPLTPYQQKLVTRD
jgi:hypothetical protein